MSSDIQKRLNEIRNTALQSLSELEVLALLEERKFLEAELVRLEEESKALAAAEEERLRLEALKDDLREKIQKLRESIHPDQSDDELLRIIAEKKELEKALVALEGEVRENKPAANEKEEKDQSIVKNVVQKKKENEVKEEVIAEEQKSEILDTKEGQELEESKEEDIVEEEKTLDDKISIDINATYSNGGASQNGKVSGLEREEGAITLDASLQTDEYHGYLEELKANINSLGSFLQSLPQEVKRNKAFMFEVAKIDPAYAMHYADKDTLKKDESFNIRIAGMNNGRNTGNPISEMLPNMRTSAVILAAVKNDFKNVRFLLPEMEDYDEIIMVAKKAALEAVRTLRDAHDIDFLIPPILQKDKKFMEEVKKASLVTKD